MSLGTEIALIKALGNGGGSGGGVLIVTDTDGTLNKTWQEIHDAPIAVLKIDSYNCICMDNTADSQSAMFSVVFVEHDNTGNIQYLVYLTNSASGYPVNGAQ